MQTFEYPNRMRVKDGHHSWSLVGPATMIYQKNIMKYDLDSGNIEQGEVLCVSFRLRMSGVTGNLRRIGIEPELKRADGSDSDYFGCWVTSKDCKREADGSLSYDGIATRVIGPFLKGYSTSTNGQPYIYVQNYAQNENNEKLQISAGGGIYIDHAMITWGQMEKPRAWAPAAGEVWPE